MKQDEFVHQDAETFYSGSIYYFYSFGLTFSL